jgi:hypothetical protein
MIESGIHSLKNYDMHGTSGIRSIQNVCYLTRRLFMSKCALLDAMTYIYHSSGTGMARKPHEFLERVDVTTPRTYVYVVKSINSSPAAQDPARTS